jgi:hypothetical protein
MEKVWTGRAKLLSPGEASSGVKSAGSASGTRRTRTVAARPLGRITLSLLFDAPFYQSRGCGLAVERARA